MMNKWGDYIIEDQLDNVKRFVTPQEYRSVLYHSAVCNSTNIVEWLITGKLDPDDCFVSVDQVDVLRLFIRHCKRLDLCVVLEYALMFEYSIDYIRMLMFHGARLDPKTREFESKHVIEWEDQFVNAKENAMTILRATKTNKRLRDVGQLIARAVWEFY